MEVGASVSEAAVSKAEVSTRFSAITRIRLLHDGIVLCGETESQSVGEPMGNACKDVFER